MSVLFYLGEILMTQPDKVIGLKVKVGLLIMFSNKEK